jgi:DNA polymerase (family 10)
MPDNYAIADQFSLLSKLMDIHQENSFKAKSYGSAAFSIEKLPMQLESIPKEQIASLKGIGDSTARKIIEILETGKLIVLEELISNTPEGVLEMMQIKGIGPKKISTIWKEMGIEGLGELLYACNENRLLLYKGFGEKTQKNVKEAIEFYFRHQGHFLYADIETYALHMQEVFVSQFKENKFMICGDFVRQMPTLEKLCWVTDCNAEELGTFLKNNAFETVDETDEMLQAKGIENVMLEFQFSPTNQLQKRSFILNGSEAFVDAWLNKYPASLDNMHTDQDAFSAASIRYIPSFLREDPAIIEQAIKASVMDIIQPTDIKSIIHSHSDWSDGTNTIEEMAKACIDKGFEYMVISDHSKSAFYANGLTEERVKAQHQYIDELNRKYAPFKIFKSIESDILNDGSLDYSDNLLSTFDLVIASVHSNLKMNEEKAMQRVMAAIENPFTTILGHPTGRLLLSRKGYPLNHEKIIDACIANKVVIEINAHPRRLDLDWTWIARAQEKGALLSINPDAHNVDGYNDIRYGTLAAQKGGLKKENNLSSFSLSDFEAYLRGL